MSQEGLPLGEMSKSTEEGQPPGIVFKARVATGKHFSELGPEELARNLITTRILRLRGLETGHNAGADPAGQVVDSFERYIYIHGTNHEDRLGTPFSGGCIEMANLGILELFEEVRARDLVWIED